MNARYSTPKSYPRSARAETRNRAKDELKRVINAVEKVRKWERRWVLLKDSTIYVYKWVPVSGQAAPKTTVQKTAAALTALSNSNENSNDATNTNSQFGLNEESNTGFSETGFESDSQSNQAISNNSSQQSLSQMGSTDFSALVREEKQNKGK
ncbi:unnamed protein product [Bursaphelenchus xylophilus]|uniref:(pine wood nematode) hypothetical protein n=1 Tax=Bursaphelenchus xylophilus TaxID=6326 RepID=A0A1I7S269_BURXY|nr:unnamed protein product [Bursaphelenchus xylophilus]CAG9114853.1 unnamed protein product [Bursaphelenchus xylophilus]